MHGRNLALWCCTVLLVASSSESRANSTTWSNDEQNNSTVRYEIHANVLTMNRSDDAGLLRYNVHKNSTMDNDDVHANYTSNDRKDGDSVQYEFDAHSMKNHSGGNRTPMVLRANSTKVNDKNNSTSLRHELGGNLTQVEDRNNLMLSELLEEFNEDKKKNVVPYEMCSNSTCIPLCCPLGNSFIKEECIAGKGNYPFPDVYEHASNDSEETSGKRPKLDEIFQLTVYDPCKLGRYLLNRVDCPQDEHRFLANGSLYLPHSNNIVESYCLAVIHGNKYEVSVCFPIDEVVETDGIPVGAVGMTVSLPFLLTTFVVYSILPELWNMHGYTLRGYVGSLFVAYIFLVTFQLTPQAKISDSICIAAAFIIHFSFLASFFWLNVMCFDIWWTFGGFRSLQGSVNQRERKKFVMYSIYAWGSASIFTIICATMDFVPSVPKEFIRPEFGAESCWFRTDEARALYFYGPMTVTVVCNICLFISTALKIIRHKKDTAHHLRGSESRRHDDNKQWFNLYLKLFIVMGINWSMEIVSWLFENAAPKYVWYLTDLTNALQGLIIFIIFVWKEKIKRLLLKKFGCQGRGPFSNNSTRSVYHSSASRTCTTTTSTVIPLQEKISPYVQTNCRTKSSSDEADP